MYYQIQILLISALLVLGIYEIFQLTKLGSIVANTMRFITKWLYNSVLTKKSWKNAYKYQHD